MPESYQKYERTHNKPLKVAEKHVHIDKKVGEMVDKNVAFELVIECARDDEEGAKHDIGLVGMRAMDSMRLEKSYRMFGTDLNAENSLLEAGLARFAKLDKNINFQGQQALLKQREDGVPNKFVTIEVDADDADCFGAEPIYMDGEVVGRGTAGGYGHYVKKSLLMGYVKTGHAKEGAECQVRVLDQMRPARIIGESPYDPSNMALRA